MSKRTYPHYVGKVGGVAKPSGKCQACDSPATCYVEVQWSWFRSDDATYRVCEEHRKYARVETAKFCEAAGEAVS